MKKLTWTFAALAAALLLESYAGSAGAQTGEYYQTWISATGSSDNNTSTGCQPSAPCKTFLAALSATIAGGEVNCLGPGEPNTSGGAIPVNITGAVAINCLGTVGERGASTFDGFFINASGAVVTLRGLNIDGYVAVPGNPAGSNGVAIQAAAAVNIEDCVIENFLQSGISVTTSANTVLTIRNTVLRNNASYGGTDAGIYINPGSGVTATVSIDHSQINGNYFGIVVDGRSGGIIKGTISDSVVSGNTENGITALSSGSSTVLMIDQTKVSGNLAGLFAGGSNAGMLARNSTVYGNAIGLDTTGGGALYTYGNNSVNGNTTNGAFTGTAGLQ
jgi:hypothetical protein